MAAPTITVQIPVHLVGYILDGLQRPIESHTDEDTLALDARGTELMNLYQSIEKLRDAARKG